MVVTDSRLDDAVAGVPDLRRRWSRTSRSRIDRERLLLAALAQAKETMCRCAQRRD
jgi:hypothetical protein